jgi:hypothetical protein
VGSLLSAPSDDMTQICESRNATASVSKWKCGAEMGGNLGGTNLLEDRGGKEKGVKRNLDVVVGAGGGEAVGGGVEVEAEHRLQVVPVDLHRPAPHLGLVQSNSSPSSSSIGGLDSSSAASTPNLSLLLLRARSLSRVWFGGGCLGGKREAIGRAAQHSLPPSPCRSFTLFFFLERCRSAPLLCCGFPRWASFSSGLFPCD